MNVFVGLSGGVDSSVAAALLQKEGHVVHGVYLKVWSPDLEDLMQGCPWEEDVQYASATAKHLGISFSVWDVSKEYYDKVVSYFFAEYKAGRTPNPDIMCNREIKFGIFLKRACAEGADMIATGHYVRKYNSPLPPLTLRGEVPPLKVSHRLWRDPASIKNNSGGEGGEEGLLCAVDKNKDQSYFLYSLSQKQLRHALFPIGEYTKPEVRAMAKEWGLPTANRKDSQGLCFLGKISVRDFLKTRLPPREGDLVTADGKVVGKHEGAQYFTIGQRHGIGSPGGGTPYFVVSKDIQKNKVTVAKGKDDAALYQKEMQLENVHWISNEASAFPLDCMTRIRYRQPLQEAKIDFSPLSKGDATCLPAGREGVTVTFKQPQRAITSGQACVFYQGEHMLGGGVIR
ncbi:MAG: tRNA 2-thiouridine(34) synthase MnmA [bacterium]|nr:tRNA 2-thiouridine(34) synthase MnmA [bacterium]